MTLVLTPSPPIKMSFLFTHSKFDFFLRTTPLFAQCHSFYWFFWSLPLPSFESLIIWSKVAEEPWSKYCEESWDWLACSKTRGSQISGIDLRSVYPEDKIEWSKHQGITKSQVSLHIGCGNKSIYLQLLAILWKYRFASTPFINWPITICWI